MNKNIDLYLNQAIEDVNYEPNILPAGIKMYGVTVPMDSNPIKNVQNVCGTLFPTQVSCSNDFKLYNVNLMVNELGLRYYN